MKQVLLLVVVHMLWTVTAIFDDAVDNIIQQEQAGDVQYSSIQLDQSPCQNDETWCEKKDKYSKYCTEPWKLHNASPKLKNFHRRIRRDCKKLCKTCSPCQNDETWCEKKDKYSKYCTEPWKLHNASPKLKNFHRRIRRDCKKLCNTCKKPCNNCDENATCTKNHKCICNEGYNGDGKTCIPIVNGGLSEWSHWSNCSQHCGVGTKTRSRSCSNPKPTTGGADCVGDTQQTVQCKDKDCPVDGVWTEWGQWTQCAQTCGDGGTTTRRRQCDGPQPQHGGKMCEGKGEELKPCNQNTCPEVCTDTMAQCGAEYITKNCHLEYVWKQCKKTCRKCGKGATPTTTITPPTTTTAATTKTTTTALPTTSTTTTSAPDCTDSMSVCGSVKNSCSSEYVWSRCRKTCNKCEKGAAPTTTIAPPPTTTTTTTTTTTALPTTTTTTTTTSAPDCTDSMSVCGSVKNSCNSEYVWSRCRKTCNKCEKGVKTTPSPCRDRFSMCKKYKAQCGNNYIKVRCKNTCGACKKPKDKVSTTTKTTTTGTTTPRPTLQPPTCGRDVFTTSHDDNNNNNNNNNNNHRDFKRIVGGEAADEHRWIWMAMLFYQGSFKCGATLITDDILLTAAHCVRRRNKDAMSVKIGYHDKKDGESGQVRMVSEVIAHGKYRIQYGSLIENDIALIKVTQKFHLGSTVGIACLPENQSKLPSKDAECYLTGWGRTRSGPGNGYPSAVSPDILQQVLMPVAGDVAGRCNHEYMHKHKQFCGGEPNSNIAACQGDSGGPFVCKVKGRWVLEGLVSFGHPDCIAKKGYSVFTRVSAYGSWLRDGISKLNQLS